MTPEIREPGMRFNWEAPDVVCWAAFVWLAVVSFFFIRDIFNFQYDRYGQRINLDWMVQRTKHFFGIWTGGEGDTNFSAARDAAYLIDGEAGDGEWPAEAEEFSAEALKKVVGYVEEVEAKVVGPANRAWAESGELARDMIWQDAARLLGFDKDLGGEDRARKTLRLWHGCLDGAKTIAISTCMGRNWPWWRKRMAKNVQERSENDYYMMVGALAAYAFKRGRNEPVSFLGVPSENVLRLGRDISEET